MDLKVYGYTLPQVPDHKGYIKIGETSRSVQDRIREQVNTVGLTPDIKFDKIAKHKNGQWFHDSDLHRYLISRGIQRHNFGTSANEWFYFNGNIDQAEVMTDEFIASGSQKQQVSLVQTDYQLREEQAEAVAKTYTYYQNNDNDAEFLWNAKPRFGKTLTTYDFMLQIEARNTLIVTNRPAIANSWYEDFYKFISHKDSNMKFVSETDTLKGKGMSRQEFINFYLDHPEKAKQVAFISLQDLKGARFAGGPYNKLEWVGKVDWDLLVIDEAHEGVDTVKTDRAFDKINRQFTLHLSGTPFKAIANEKFTADQIYNWSYLDEQKAKANWEASLDTNPYEKLPTLSLFTYQMSSLIQDQLASSHSSGEDQNMDYAFDLNEFFSTKENGNFVYEESVLKFLDNLCQNKMPFSPTEYRSKLNHTFWLLPRVASAKALEKLLKQHSVFKEYKIVLAAGDGESIVDSDDDFISSLEGQKNVKSFDKVKQAIDQYPKTITLSVGQLTTGVTIPEWTAVLMLSNIQSPSLYFQAAFRAQNPYEYEQDGQLYRKENAYIFDFAPERTLVLFDEFANNLTPGFSQTSREREDQIRQLLNFFPVIAEDEDGEMQEIDASQVLTIPQKIKSREVVRQGFMSNLLFNNVVGIFGAPKELIGILNKVNPEENKKHLKDKRSIDLQDPMLNDRGKVEVPKEIVVSRTDEVFGDKIIVTEDKPESTSVTELTDRFMDKVEDDFVKFQDIFGLNNTQTNRSKTKVRKRIKDVVEEELDYYTSQSTYIQTDYNDALKDPENTETMLELDEKRQAKVSQLQQEFQENISKRTKEVLEKSVEEESKKVEERKKNQTEEDTRAHLRGFTRTIPAFLMAYGGRETTLSNFEENIDPDTFIEITSINIEEFKKLRDGFTYTDDQGQEREFKGFFDETVFNSSVQGFFDKKEESANYFDDSLKEDIFDYIPNQQTNQIYTPRGVVKLMVDKLEEENPDIFTHRYLKFIDLYTKSGLYLTELVKRLDKGLADQIPDQSDRIKWILENQVYGVAPSNIIYNIAKNYVYGIHDDIDTGNLVQWDMAVSAQEGTMEEDLLEAYGGEQLKFDVVIGNPPYQDEIIGDNKRYAAPIYHKFLDSSYEVSDLVEMIHPARFLFNAGSTPKDWNKKMLEDQHLKVLYYEVNSDKIFPNTDIKGGIAITYRDVNKTFSKIGPFIPYSEVQSILKKVESNGIRSLMEMIFTAESYKFTEVMHNDYPEAEKLLSRGHKFDLRTNVLEKLSFIFKDNGDIDEGDIQIYGRVRNDRAMKWIPGRYITGPENFDSYKVFVPKSNATGALGETLSSPVIADPFQGHTQTFISIGNFNTKNESKACLKYIKTKFARIMLGILKVTQDNPREKWEFVPLQDFTSNSDIDWSQSIPEIDQQLYAKYGLNDEEIDFIEEKVQSME